jgi:polyadenylate-binding protein
MRFKNSKKRCNLYVRNFGDNTTQQDLMDTFSRFGEIESLKMNKNNDGKNVYAFVCYKSPESAAQAKANLQNFNLNGRHIFINNYEIKEIRKAQMEDIRDRSDF